MKKSPAFIKRTYAALCLAYTLLCLAASIFYIRAFFWKGTTKLCGTVWLCLTVLFCSAQLLGLLRQSRVHKILSMLCAALVSCIQIPAIGAWLALSDGRHTYMVNFSVALITPRGALFHTAILLIGLVLLYYDAKLLPKIEQP